MHRLMLLGLNHNTAPLELREKLAFNPAARTAALNAFKDRFPHCEAVLLSTCNRVELYVVREPHALSRMEQLPEFLAELRGLDAQSLRPHLYEKSDRDVVAHLFSVACSLDSMVLGETQIVGQVREAYEAAGSVGLAGGMLHPLFQRAAAAAKQVMAETALTEGRMSVASVAVDYARRIFDTFSDKTVLVIGAGKMSHLVIRNLVALSPGQMLICNRDAVKAQELVRMFGGTAVAFENLSDCLATADIVVSSTGATQPIITRKTFEGVMKRRKYRPVFLMDIALPRDIDPSIAELENVYLYNLDDLQRVVAATRTQRQSAIDAAMAIVEEHVRGFSAWHRTRQLGPAIHQLYRKYHALAEEELSRTLARFPHLSDQEQAHLQDLTRRIVNKLLHDPIQMLRKTELSHGSESQYLHALQMLFNLHLGAGAPALPPSADTPGENWGDPNPLPAYRERRPGEAGDASASIDTDQTNRQDEPDGPTQQNQPAPNDH